MSIRRGEPPTLSNRSQQIRPRSPAEMLEPSRAPERPQGSKARRESGRVGGFLSIVSSLMTTALIAMVIAAGGFYIVERQFTAAGPLTQERQITIPRGEGRIEIAARLEREGFISNRWTFLLNHLYRSMTSSQPLDLKAGDYKFEAGASMQKVLDAIAKGKAVLNRLSLPEGLTSQQMINRIIGSPDLTGDVAEVPTEGSLLPDTYNFAKGMARQDLINQMQEQQKAVLNEAWENRAENLPINSPQEALVLASIVEKETGLAEERARVAAVFVNRLRQNMRLQSDPTIIYGLVGGKGSLGRSITRDDKASKTPYNTYLINGLPPTPICNPGRDAIHAVLNPADTQDLYFVANGTGGHTFTTNYKDHSKAVAEWRKIEKATRKAEKEKQAKQQADGQAAIAPTEDQEAKKTAEASTSADGAAGLQLINAGGENGAAQPKVPPVELSPAAIAAISENPISIPLPERKPRQ